MQERKALGKDFDEDKLADDKHGAFVEECKRAGNWQRWWWSFGYDSSSGHDYLFTRSVLEMRGTDELVYELSIVGEDVTCTQTFNRVHWPCQNFPFGTECWNISLLQLRELYVNLLEDCLKPALDSPRNHFWWSSFLIELQSRVLLISHWRALKHRAASRDLLLFNSERSYGSLSVDVEMKPPDPNHIGSICVRLFFSYNHSSLSPFRQFVWGLRRSNQMTNWCVYKLWCSACIHFSSAFKLCEIDNVSWVSGGCQR